MAIKNIYGAFKVKKILRLISIFDDRIQIKLKSIRTPKVKDESMALIGQKTAAYPW